MSNYINKTIRKTLKANEERHYIDDPSEAPEGVEVQEGERGGIFFVVDGADGSADGPDADDVPDDVPPHERWGGGNREFDESEPGKPWTWAEPKPDEVDEWVNAAESTPEMSEASNSFEEAFHGDNNTKTEYTNVTEEGGVEWDEERVREVHDPAVEKALSEAEGAKTGEDEQPVGVVLLGPPGAGKGWWEENLENGEYGEDFGREFLRINSDDTKPDVPEYNGANAAYVHDEASHIAKNRIQPEAIEQGYNLMYDSVATTPGSTMDIMDEMEDAGYDVRAVYVDAPPNKSVHRATTRFEDEGRYTPLEYVKNARGSLEEGEGSRGTWGKVLERVPQEKTAEFVNDEFGNAPRVRGELGEDIFKYIRFILSDGGLYGR